MQRSPTCCVCVCVCDLGTSALTGLSLILALAPQNKNICLNV